MLYYVREGTSDREIPLISDTEFPKMGGIRFGPEDQGEVRLIAYVKDRFGAVARDSNTVLKILGFSLLVAFIFVKLFSLTFVLGLMAVNQTQIVLY